ncbi:single tm domain protein [Entamoeba histolytica]|uniref:Single tm domain protein n=1 Tax=Entamoeba histolytica TaxID=5759 RepID=A0A175JKY0_ENTHI|nr:single tm domain protein [Entamoeba histolytica]
MNEVNDYDLNYVHSLEEAITELTEKVLELEDELKRIKNTGLMTFQDEPSTPIGRYFK